MSATGGLPQRRRAHRPWIGVHQPRREATDPAERQPSPWRTHGNVVDRTPAPAGAHASGAAWRILRRSPALRAHMPAATNTPAKLRSRTFGGLGGRRLIARQRIYVREEIGPAVSSRSTDLQSEDVTSGHQSVKFRP